MVFALMKSKNSEESMEIGWKEWVCLPDLGVPAIKAKVDTGARTSALHTFHIETFKQQDIDMVKFHIHPLQKKSELSIICVAPVVEIRNVRDSGGHEEERYVIQTTLGLGKQQWPIEVTLTNRDNMMFRMLLGRTAIRNRNIIINTDKSYLTGKKLRKAYSKSITESFRSKK